MKVGFSWSCNNWTEAAVERVIWLSLLAHDQLFYNRGNVLKSWQTADCCKLFSNWLQIGGLVVFTRLLFYFDVCVCSCVCLICSYRFLFIFFSFFSSSSERARSCGRYDVYETEGELWRRRRRRPAGAVVPRRAGNARQRSRPRRKLYSVTNTFTHRVVVASCIRVVASIKPETWMNLPFNLVQDRFLNEFN